MSGAGRLAALAVAAALCALTVKKQAPEISLVLALCAGTAVLFWCARELAEVVELVTSLGERGGLPAGTVAPVVKVAGIAMVTRIASSVCRDAQQSGLAGFVETGGTILALAAVIPLLTAVLDMLTQLL